MSGACRWIVLVVVLVASSTGPAGAEVVEVCLHVAGGPNTTISVQAHEVSANFFQLVGLDASFPLHGTAVLSSGAIVFTVTLGGVSAPPVAPRPTLILNGWVDVMAHSTTYGQGTGRCESLGGLAPCAESTPVLLQFAPC
jgi:hypothetical protein